MTIYALFSWTLVLLLGVTLPWPLNVPLAALAYKVRLGDRPIDLEPTAFWLRSACVSLGLCLLSLAALGLTWLLASGGEVPAGPIQIVIVSAYLPAGVWYVFWMFALEDLLEGLSVFTLYVLIGGLPLLLLGLLFGFWRSLPSWLLLPTS